MTDETDRIRHLQEIGSKGGSARSEAKTRAARENALKHNIAAPIRTRSKVMNRDAGTACGKCGHALEYYQPVYVETWGVFCSMDCRKSKANELNARGL